MPNLLVPVDDPCILQDVDTPEDYRGLTTAEA
jgi:CTP:molybdopterin cytidylyltransferase MocA